METIRNYLETMFQNLPNTNDVQKAKYELGQMMEDKYTELRSEGKTDNEAIGIVISEFGNLDDIAEDLGIGNFLKTQTFEKSRMLSMKDVKSYIADKTKAGILIGIGVLLCIISPCACIMGFNIMGVIFLFTAIAVAVGIFIFADAITGKWDYLGKEPCSIDFATTEYVHNERENYRMTNALLIAIGVILCILCVVPVVMFADVLGTAVMFVIIGIGVLLLVTTGIRSGAYDTLLKLNDINTMGGNFVTSQKNQVHYNNKAVAALMSVYWPTVTCIYLCWSFLTFDWHITWIVWVIASVVETFIKNLYRK